MADTLSFAPPPAPSKMLNSPLVTAAYASDSGVAILELEHLKQLLPRTLRALLCNSCKSDFFWGGKRRDGMKGVEGVIWA